MEELIGIATNLKDGLSSKENTPILLPLAFPSSGKWNRITKIETQILFDMDFPRSSSGINGIDRCILSMASKGNNMQSSLTKITRGDNDFVIKEDENYLYFRTMKGGGGLSKCRLSPVYLDNYQTLTIQQITESELSTEAIDVNVIEL